MLRASEKEYYDLKREISELRSCITRYIGYIISVFGASVLFNKLIFDKPDSSLNILVLLLLTMIIITLLFDIVWYKFISHNRYVGYFQLLSQEISHHEFEKSEEFLEKKLYLDKYQDQNSSPKKTEDKNLLTWEYIISRLINAEFHQKEIDDLLKATDKVRFVFKIPDSFKYNYFVKLNCKYTNIDREFFRNIIYELYWKDKEELYFSKRIQNLFKSLSKFWKSIKYLYSPIRVETYDVKKIIIDKKYLSSGWQYPKKITQIAFISLSLLIIMFVFILCNDFQFYDFSESIKIINIYPILITFFVIFIFLFWNNRYLSGLTDIINGNKSIDHYCWKFFIFRVQILNSNGIIPVYFSRNFIRYFKSRIILADLESRENDFKVSSKEECVACNENIKINESDSKVFCGECFDKYKIQLKESKKFDKKYLKAHYAVKEAVRKRMKIFYYTKYSKA